MTTLDTPTTIRLEAQRLGFNRVRFCTAEQAPGIAAFDRFVEEGRHGEMEWLARGRAPRADPTLLLPGARSAVVLGMDHHHPQPPDPGGLTGRVARYAWGRDYHNLIGKRLRKLARNLRTQIPGFDCYWGVDSRPLLERAWAERSGLAFIGKNCMAIVPGQSSHLFLAVMLTTVDLPVDPPIAGSLTHCGSCRRCLDVCPTNAFTAAGQLDARKCISYLTIEHRGEIPTHMRPAMGRWVFGCDDCQDVCPHNHHPTDSQQDDFAPRQGHAWLDLEWVLLTEDNALDQHFEGSPIRRCKPSGLKRNACIVLGNIGDRAARTALHHALAHPDPLVSSHARWALDQI